MKNSTSKPAISLVNGNITQDALVADAGISTPTIQRAESGASIQLLKLIRILRAIKLIENLEPLAL